MPALHLSLAITAYDHVIDLVRENVRAEGITLTCVELPVEEIFFRMADGQEWDVAEFSMAKYAAFVSTGDSSLVAIPAFPSRMFRQSAIYIAAASDVRTPQDLRGKRVGIPEWAQTAGIYVRGYLQHQAGVHLRDIRWVQGGLNEPGRMEKVPLALADGVEITRIADRSLDAMLVAGDLDAIVSAREPAAFLAGNPRVRRLFPEFRAVEEAYYRETRIFPIMHAVVIKRSLLERHPWVAMNLFTAFDRAKRNSEHRLTTLVTPRVPLPWFQSLATDVREVFGGDCWPYGIEPNRTTLTAFLRYACEQGVTSRALQVEELFPKGFAASFRV